MARLLLALTLLRSGAAVPGAEAPAAVRAFLGLRYALPPVGERRLAPTELAPLNASTLDPAGGPIAGAFGSKCLQHGGGDEDCLFANVYAPVHALPAAAGGKGSGGKLPIMVWIHGGGFTAGTGNSYNGTVLASSQDIIVVTINYRLGGLGFFATEEATRVPATHGSTGGMNGLLDQITALRWVQANGAQFGGDVSQITIAGESAGGESVCNLLVSPPARGLFHRAIIESGPCLVGTKGWGPHEPGPPDNFLAVCDKLAQTLTGLPKPTLADLRALKDPRGLVNMTTIKDSVDGYVIPKQPSEYFAEGRLNAVDVMLGGNSFDGLASCECLSSAFLWSIGPATACHCPH